jgi:hypothetical protein
VDRGRRAWRTAIAVALRKICQEVGKVARLGAGRVSAALGEEAPELEQVRAVGGERVAGKPPLELEVSEEIEHQRLVALGRLRVGCRARWRNRGHTKYFRGQPLVPP